MTNPAVGVVVVNWNGSRYTIPCLASVRRSHYPRLRLVVVDNGSDAEDLILLRGAAEGATLLELDRNLGFAGGYNAGIRRALQDPAVEYVLVLNNDTLIDPNCITALVSAAQSRQADMISPAVLAASDRVSIDRLGLILTRALLAFDMKRWEGREPFCPSGCAALYSRRLLESLALDGQYFDEDFFAYAEDLDLGIRAVLQGYRSVLAPDAVVYHHGGMSSAGTQVPLRLRHRNTIWCLLKSVPRPVLLRNAGWIIAAQALGLIRAVGRGHGRAVLEAKLAGLRGLPLMLRKRRGVLRGSIDMDALDRGLDPRPFYLSLSGGNG